MKILIAILFLLSSNLAIAGDKYCFETLNSIVCNYKKNEDFTIFVNNHWIKIKKPT